MTAQPRGRTTVRRSRSPDDRRPRQPDRPGISGDRLARDLRRDRAARCVRCVAAGRLADRAVPPHGHDPAVGSAPIAELLHAAEDSTGLYFRARLFDVPALDLVREGLRSGAISGASFRFTVPAGGDRWRGTTTREVLRADVVELGPVVWPASPYASVTLRQRLRRLTGSSTSTTPTGTAVLSARARAALEVLAAGAVAWDELSPAVQAEVVAVAPRRVAAAAIAASPQPVGPAICVGHLDQAGVDPCGVG